MSTTLDPRPVTPARLAWLRTQLDSWETDGLLDDAQAAAILDSYHPSRRFGLTGLLFSIGAIFLGFGLIWLVAVNYEHLSPSVRFGLVAGLWLALLVGGEALHVRWSVPTAASGAIRLVAAFAFGAVVFQAAQSLQVPAYEPALVGLWGLGALAHAYAVGAIMPLAVGITASLGWYLWVVLWDSTSSLSGVLSLAVAAVVATSLAALHERWLPRFADAWREVGALLALAAMFWAALPFAGPGGFAWTFWLVAGLALAAGSAAAAVLLSRGTTRLEPLVAVGAGVVSVALVLWEAVGTGDGGATFADWAQVSLAVAGYAVLAVAVAALGTLRDSWRLTALSTGALVVFTTVQSFAVFAQIIQGAWLFVALGLVFVTTGYLFDRARRRLARNLTEVS